MNVCVFCSIYDVAEEYTTAAKMFAELLATRGHTLVWGGGDHGMMGLVANTVKENGGKIIGISIERLRGKSHVNADEMQILKDLPARKAMMLERSDAFATLLGGIGTLDEMMEMLELKKHHMHDKPIAFLNTNGFYDGLKQQLLRMKDEGFIERPLEEYLYFADTPLQAIEYIENHGN